MVQGKPFEVSKEVYERAKAKCAEPRSEYYMTSADQEELFSIGIRRGYGLYNCKVHEEDGKYICTWMRGSTCD